MLTTAEYQAQNKELHNRPEYGASTVTRQFWPSIRKICEVYCCESVLDYGCGKGVFASCNKDLDVHEYDPAIDGKDSDPQACDLLISLDVLEHIEPELIDDVLAHMASKMNKFGFLSIATRPAKKVLPDGRNAHLIQEHAGWWITKLSNHFKVIQFSGTDKELVVMVCAADKSSH